jgi:hypothetical protein
MQKRISGKTPLHKLKGVKLAIVRELVVLKKGVYTRETSSNLII